VSVTTVSPQLSTRQASRLGHLAAETEVAARRHAQARRRLERAVVSAAQDGASSRAIAAAIGRSHVRVLQILRGR
jgi:hypothetical protein